MVIEIEESITATYDYPTLQRRSSSNCSHLTVHSFCAKVPISGVKPTQFLKNVR
jgi:hypothetical protein